MQAVPRFVVFVVTLATMACGGTDLTLPDNGGPPARISIARGNGQTGAPGTMLPDAIVAEVTDSSGTPVAGQQVEFAPLAPGSAVAPAMVTTDDKGEAGARWVLGIIPGRQEVIARVIGEGVPPSLSVRFTAWADEGAPSASANSILQ